MLHKFTSFKRNYGAESLHKGRLLCVNNKVEVLKSILPENDESSSSSFVGTETLYLFISLVFCTRYQQIYEFQDEFISRDGP